MAYVLGTAEAPDQERQYYAGPPRKKISGRMAHGVTRIPDYATKFATREDAQAMLEELGGGYVIVEARPPGPTVRTSS
jgi:hypothetical protein